MGKRKFTREFKIEAVQQATRGGRSQAAVARDLGISANLLVRWKKQLEEEGKEAFPGKGHLKPEDEERRRLEREIRQLREENEFLKNHRARSGALPVGQKLWSAYSRVSEEERPSVFWCLEPVKKHGPGVAADLRLVTLRRSRLGK